MIDGHDSSPATAPNPCLEAQGWSIVIPPAPGKAGYITRAAAAGELVGKSVIRIRGRFEGPEGSSVVPYGEPQFRAMLTPYFQRCGDDWSASGRFETFRWYASSRLYPIELGEFELEARFSEPWGAILTSTSSSAPAAFDAAIAQACRVGFVLGGGSQAVGHGIEARGGQVKLVVTEFTIE